MADILTLLSEHWWKVLIVLTLTFFCVTHTIMGVGAIIFHIRMVRRHRRTLDQEPQV